MQTFKFSNKGRDGFNLTYWQLIKLGRAHVRKNNDLIICIDGYEGMGKTNLGINMAMDFDENFNLEKNVIYKPAYEDIISQMKKMSKHSCIVFDEAIKVLFKRNYMFKQQKALVEFFNTSRKLNLIVILVLPSIHDLDAYFRQHRVAWWLHVYQRGKAIAFRKRRQNPMRPDYPYEKLAKKFDDYAKGKWLSESEYFRIIKKMPNYWGYLEFNALRPKIEKKYLEYNAEAYKDEELDMQLRTKDEWREKSKKAIAQLYEFSEHPFSVKMLSEIFNSSTSTISKFLKEENVQMRKKGFDYNKNKFQ